jgi:precorrin-3B synthase
VRLHRADDGPLARVQVAGGLLDTGRAEALVAAAEELGDGHLDLTSRGNVQLRGLRAEDAGAGLTARLQRAGLLPADPAAPRAVVASPLAGLDGRGPDVAAVVRALADGLAERGLALSGRFLFAVDDGRGDTAGLGADVTLTARQGEGYAVRVGADTVLDRAPRDAGHAAALALDAAAAFLDLADGTDTVWRVADLDASGAAVAEHMKAPYGTYPAPTPAAPPAHGIVPHPDGARAALHIGVPLGRTDAARWRLLIEKARRLGDGTLRLTPWRGVVLPGLAVGEAAGALAELAGAGFVAEDASPWSTASACAGRPGCGKALADVRADLTAALSEAEANANASTNGDGDTDTDTDAVANANARTDAEANAGDDAARAEAGASANANARANANAATADTPAGLALLPVHVSGCSRRCGRPGGGAWVDVLALGEDAYQVTAPGAAPATTSRAGLAAALGAARRPHPGPSAPQPSP